MSMLNILVAGDIKRLILMIATTWIERNVQLLDKPHLNYVRPAVRAAFFVLIFAAAKQPRLENKIRMYRGYSTSTSKATG